MAADFEGVKVLDFTQVLAGPFAAQQLAMLGAQVLKVEPVAGGDQMRDRMLPSRLAQAGMASPFLTLNLGKRSLALDLKKAEGLEIAMRLVADADVMVHNFRAGVVDRLGLQWEAVREANPKIIYCAISGFGSHGPRSREAAFDGAIQAASGMMANNGHPETGATRTGFFPVDMMTGMTAAFAIAAALHRRAHTGEGKAIDVAMLDVAITLQASSFAQYLVEGVEGGLTGNSSATGSPSADRFDTVSGMVLMSAVGQGQVEALCAEMGNASLLKDPRFSTVMARAAHRTEFRELLLAVFATDTARSWERRLGAVGVPISVVNSIAQTSAEPQLSHRGVFVDVPATTGVDGPVRLVGSAFSASDASPAVSRAAPALGEHSREVLLALGYSPDIIERLIAAGIVGAYRGEQTQ